MLLLPMKFSTCPSFQSIAYITCALQRTDVEEETSGFPFSGGCFITYRKSGAPDVFQDVFAVLLDNKFHKSHTETYLQLIRRLINQRISKLFI